MGSFCLPGSFSFVASGVAPREVGGRVRAIVDTPHPLNKKSTKHGNLQKRCRVTIRTSRAISFFCFVKQKTRFAKRCQTNIMVFHNRSIQTRANSHRNSQHQSQQGRHAHTHTHPWSSERSVTKQYGRHAHTWNAPALALKHKPRTRTHTRTHTQHTHK
jgi:hypothetical protein